MLNFAGNYTGWIDDPALQKIAVLITIAIITSMLIGRLAHIVQDDFGRTTSILDNFLEWNQESLAQDMNAYVLLFIARVKVAERICGTNEHRASAWNNA